MITERSEQGRLGRREQEELASDGSRVFPRDAIDNGEERVW